MPVGEAERRWGKAKKIAGKEGHAEDYAYITGIFKKMMRETSMILARLKAIAYTAPTPRLVLQRIRDIVGGTIPLSPQTCWNKVGLFLQRNPTTRGYILFYQIEGDADHVAHCVLVDRYDRTLADTLRGVRKDNNSVYVRTDGQEYVLLQTVHWA